MTDPAAMAWTVEEACDYWAGSAIPVTPAQLRAVIRALPGFQRAAEGPSGDKGGRGKAMYDIAELMKLRSALLPWL